MTDGRTRRRFLRGIGVTGVAVVAGCGEDSSGTTDPKTTADDGSTTTALATPTRTPTTTETPSTDLPPSDTDTPTDEPTEPQIAVPENELRDEPIEILVEGLPPDSSVTLRAVERYPEGGPLSGQFESYAQFNAVEDGTVALLEQAPNEGTYEGTDAMGLFWSMRPRDELDDPGDLTFDSPTVDGTGRAVHLRAIVDGELVAEAQTHRSFGLPEVTQREPEGDVVGRLYLPPGEGPHPAAMIIPGGGGGLPVDPARLLASRGVAAMAVQYFGQPETLPDRPVEVPLEYFSQCMDWLLDQPEVQEGGVGVSGLSLGGTAALLVGTNDDRVEAVAATSALTVLFSSRVTDGESPFSLDGRPLPAIPVDYAEGERRDGKLATAPAFRKALERASEDEIEEATIPVQDVNGELLFVTGKADAVVDATALAERSVRQLEEHGVGFDYAHHAYDDAGHLISIPYGVTTQMQSAGERLFGGTPAGLAAAEADSWPRIKGVLKAE